MMQGKTFVHVNDGAFIGGIVFIIALIFLLGFLCNANLEGNDTVIFTRDELEMISELQEREDEKGTGAQIYATKNEDGHLIIGWDFTEDHRIARSYKRK